MVNLQMNLLIQNSQHKEKIMNSFKLLLAALLLGTFSLTLAGCPGKKEEAAPVVEVEESADAPAATEETVEEVVEEAE